MVDTLSEPSQKCVNKVKRRWLSWRWRVSWKKTWSKDLKKIKQALWIHEEEPERKNNMCKDPGLYPLWCVWDIIRTVYLEWKVGILGNQVRWKLVAWESDYGGSCRSVWKLSLLYRYLINMSQGKIQGVWPMQVHGASCLERPQTLICYSCHL